MMDDHRSAKALKYLYKFVEAGERGYAVCASSIDNPGLKILFKSYAQQRAKFKTEILAEIHRLGGDAKARTSIRGILHRGRIHIFTALMIGREERERVVLKEALVGERAALRAYEKILKVGLPEETGQMVARQHEEICRLVDHILLMQGTTGVRTLVRLFENEDEASIALNRLQDAGFYLERIEKISVHDSLEHYEGRNNTVLETTISGAVGGALWGTVIGALAGISMEAVTIPGAIQFNGIWSLVALAGIILGGVVGMSLGFAIGTGVSGQDSYLYNRITPQGQTLLLIVLRSSQVPEAQRIMAHITPVSLA